MTAAAEVRLVHVGRGPIEVRVVPAGPGGASLPPLVFLHEGLGSLGLWRDVPDLVRAACGEPLTVVYSRHGHGRSAVVPEPRPVTYLHHEALQVLPALLFELGLHRPVLVGHSDGASIALIHAGSGQDVAGLALLAPHVMVEDRSIAGIDAARDAYLTTDLRQRLGRHHDDVDATFRGWNDVWLSPEFRGWDIRGVLGSVGCPVLVVQGEDDQYGTLAQVDEIEAGVAGPVTRVDLPGVGHAPQVEAKDATVAAVAAFVRSLSRAGDGSDGDRAHRRPSP